MRPALSKHNFVKTKRVLVIIQKLKWRSWTRGYNFQNCVCLKALDFLREAVLTKIVRFRCLVSELKTCILRDTSENGIYFKYTQQLSCPRCFASFWSGNWKKHIKISLTWPRVVWRHPRRLTPVRHQKRHSWKVFHFWRLRQQIKDVYIKRYS